MPALRSDAIQDRIYTRSRSSNSSKALPRYYADFRDFSHVGGKQEALSPAGEKRATTDGEEAVRLAEARLAELQGLQASLPATSAPDLRKAGPFVSDHLERMAREGSARVPWMRAVQKHLERFLLYFGEEADLALLTPRDIEDWMFWLAKQDNGRGGTLGSQSVVQHMNSIGKLLRRAVGDGQIAANPVSAVFKKPKVVNAKTVFLEVNEMAEILRFMAEDYRPSRSDLALPFAYELVATLALTGFREAECVGLLVSDVDLSRGVIHVTPNQYRDVKNDNSVRSLKISPQLIEILRAYLTGPHAPSGDLLFPGMGDGGGGDAMINDLRCIFKKVPMPARLKQPRSPKKLESLRQSREQKIERLTTRGLPGPKPQESLEELLQPVRTSEPMTLGSRILRHTYCAARLQTLDGGAPVSNFTVAVEMGHRDLKMIEKVYGHLGVVRHRGEHVEYRL